MLNTLHPTLHPSPFLCPLAYLVSGPRLPSVWDILLCCSACFLSTSVPLLSTQQALQVAKALDEELEDLKTLAKSLEEQNRSLMAQARHTVSAGRARLAARKDR